MHFDIDRGSIRFADGRGDDEIAHRAEPRHNTETPMKFESAPGEQARGSQHDDRGPNRLHRRRRPQDPRIVDRANVELSVQPLSTSRIRNLTSQLA